MSRIRKRDHNPVINQPTDLDRKRRRGLNGSFTSSAQELKADGDTNSILKSGTKAGNVQSEIHPRQRPGNVTHSISCVNRGWAAYINFRIDLPRVAWHDGPRRVIAKFKSEKNGRARNSRFAPPVARDSACASIGQPPEIVATHRQGYRRSARAFAEKIGVVTKVLDRRERNRVDAVLDRGEAPGRTSQSDARAI